MKPSPKSRRRARAPMWSGVNARPRPAAQPAPAVAAPADATWWEAPSSPIDARPDEALRDQAFRDEGLRDEAGQDGGRQDGARRQPGAPHPLTQADRNRQLWAYETRVKGAFARIVPTLRAIAARQHEPDFERSAQETARTALGFGLPEGPLADAWVDRLDMRSLFAHATFETFRAMSTDYFTADPLETQPQARDFHEFLLRCGFHAMNVTPCADGRLAHTISYVLRLPMGAVQRRSSAGALFDVEEALQRWAAVELSRFREGVPNLADAPTRYLKVAAYHYSSRDPDHQGCAAHGSDTRQAAAAGLAQLRAFRLAVENTHCCGASIATLLIGIDTDTDRLRIHLPNGAGEPDLDRFVDAGGLYRATAGLDPESARARIREEIARPRDGGPTPETGMRDLMARLIENNLSQIDYVRTHVGEHYPDAGHQELFIGVGTDFEEIQLRNLTYFAFMRTLEEGAPNLDVGIKIFRRLNVAHGLPVPIVLRFHYAGQVPGARERAIQRCARIAEAILKRYPDLAERGLIQTYWTLRDTSRAGSIECVGSSLPSTWRDA
ncbi:carboxysome shell carbonic anhydrase [Thiocystis violacea]|uniref:carboxysome shell carbonic anhydrase n=1 Tax=Thiocystis violacea TaxID=13725 RepID=UPI0019063BB5|nr:carboxysome shell carbonic anhydrase [Thiocystis violacea]MBK1723049.1 carboxysome shell carbonic anhydrase [Thiocystis violacea]